MKKIVDPKQTVFVPITNAIKKELFSRLSNCVAETKLWRWNKQEVKNSKNMSKS